MTNWEISIDTDKEDKFFTLTHPSNQILATIDFIVVSYEWFNKVTNCRIKLSQRQSKELDELSMRFGPIKFITITIEPVCSATAEYYFKTKFHSFGLDVIHEKNNSYEFILHKNKIVNFLALLENIQTNYPAEEINSLIPYLKNFLLNYVEVINPQKKIAEIFSFGYKNHALKILPYSNPNLACSNILIDFQSLHDEGALPDEIMCKSATLNNNNRIQIFSFDKNHQTHFSSPIDFVAVIYSKQYCLSEVSNLITQAKKIILGNSSPAQIIKQLPLNDSELFCGIEKTEKGIIKYTICRNGGGVSWHDLWGHEQNQLFKVLNGFMSGVNLYPTSRYGSTPCHSVIYAFKNENNIIRALEKFLQYHFDLNFRPRSKDKYNNSALELLYFKKKFRVLTYLNSLTNTPQRELRNHFTTLNVININNAVMTLFNNKDLKFGTMFTPTSALSDDKLNECIDKILDKVFSYDSEMKDTVRKEIKISIPGKFTNYIDRVFQNGALVGFNLYQIFNQFNDEYPNHILVHHYYSVMHPNFRSSGIMANINFHIPFALKKQFPTKEVVVFYSVLTFDGMKHTFDFLLAPKYRFPGFKKYLKSVLDAVFNESVNLRGGESDNFECSINDSWVKIIPNETTKPAKNKPSIITLYEKLYLEILGTNNNAIPLLFFTDPVNFKILIERYKRNGANFEKFVDDFSKNSTSIFSEQFSNVKITNTKLSLFTKTQNDNPFWNATKPQYHLGSKF